MKDVTELPWDSRQMLIAGHWRDASETLPLEDPSTGRVVGEIARGSSTDIDAAVDAARAARQGVWEGHRAGAGPGAAAGLCSCSGAG